MNEEQIKGLLRSKEIIKTFLEMQYAEIMDNRNRIVKKQMNEADAKYSISQDGTIFHKLKNGKTKKLKGWFDKGSYRIDLCFNGENYRYNVRELLEKYWGKEADLTRLKFHTIENHNTIASEIREAVDIYPPEHFTAWLMTNFKIGRIKKNDFK